MDTQAILVELQTLRSGEPEGALTRLRELSAAVEQVMLADRHSSAGIAAALTHQAIDYLCEGISVEQNRPDVARRNQPEVDRRFALAIKRAETWVAAIEEENANPFRR